MKVTTVILSTVLLASACVAEFWCECDNGGRLNDSEANLAKSLALGSGGWANYRVSNIRIGCWGRLWNNPDDGWNECKHCLARCADERAHAGVCKQKANLAWFEASYRRE